MSPERGSLDYTRLAITLAAALVASLIVPAAGFATHGKARKAGLDLRLERTPVIVESSYRALPPIRDDGALGENRRGGFKVSDQAAGDLYVVAGIIRRKPALIDKGLAAFDYAFRRQRENGSIGKTETDEYGNFVEAVAHSMLLLRQSRYSGRYKRKRLGYIRRLERVAPHMIKREAWSHFKTLVHRYTHRAYRVGTALTLTARLTGNRNLKRYGLEAIRLGLKRQWSNGVNPEKGGYDVRYHMVGIVYAERFTVYYPNERLTRRVKGMTGRGLKWMSGRISPDGYIRWRGSTRTCKELSSSGKPKTPGYSGAIRGFAYWGALKHRDGLREKARRMWDYFEDATTPCRYEPAAASSTGDATVGGQEGGGTLRGAQLRDVLDNYE